MDTYWNSRFIKEQMIWGTGPSRIALISEKIFHEYNLKTIIIPGAGYGRNGKYFTEHGYRVDGIEISPEAIRIGKEFAPSINYIEGSVLDTFPDKKYDAVFCYDLIHLFKNHERKIIIENCLSFSRSKGLIMISCFSDKDKTFGTGREIEENTFEVKPGKTVHFFTEHEMGNIHPGLNPVKINHLIEKIKTPEREDAYCLRYGIYEKIRD